MADPIDIPLDKILRPEEPDRTEIDAEGIRELAESIREKGLLQNIIVHAEGDNFRIIAGDRRYLAHKLLDLPTIRSEVKEVTGEDIILIRAIENDQREDLLPMDRAKVYSRLRKKFEMTVEEIARKMGKNRLTIKKYLRLLELPEEFQAALNQGKLSQAVAYVLLEIGDPELRKYYLQNAIEHGCSEKTAQLWFGDYEKTKANQYYPTEGGIHIPTDPFEIKPNYYACDACSSPVDLRDVKHLAVCPGCREAIRRLNVPT